MSNGNDILVSNGAVLNLAANAYPRGHRPRLTVLPEVKRRIWLVTFTDTISLMVAFFVLMYAMSDPQLEDYKRVKDAIQSQFKVDKNAPHQTYAGSPANMGDVDTITLPRTRRQSSLEGPYLKQVLEQRRAEQPELAMTTIRQVDRDVVIDVPMTALFSGGDYNLAEQARTITTEFSRIFNDLPNRVEIAVDLSGRANADVLVALMRGQNVLADLRAGGYGADTAILVNEAEGKPTLHFRVTHFEGQGR